MNTCDLDPSEIYPDQLTKKENELIELRRKAVGKSAQDPRGGFALSGGGIRSATFSLGEFQALAKEGLLRHIDFLATVSGGGYFGAFLGRLLTLPWAGGFLAGGDFTKHSSLVETLNTHADAIQPISSLGTMTFRTGENP